MASKAIKFLVGHQNGTNTNDTLQGYVMDLQKFERLLKQEVRSGNVEITEKEIITDKTFDYEDS